MKLTFFLAPPDPRAVEAAAPDVPKAMIFNILWLFGQVGPNLTDS
jgi:hypothetical protein